MSGRPNGRSVESWRAVWSLAHLHLSIFIYLTGTVEMNAVLRGLAAENQRINETPAVRHDRYIDEFPPIQSVSYEVPSRQD